MGLDGLDECGVPPDVDISVCCSGEDQVLRPTVTRRHHRLLLPQVPENPPFEGQAAACGTRPERFLLIFQVNRIYFLQDEDETKM